jgi:hypothetical protein
MNPSAQTHFHSASKYAVPKRKMMEWAITSVITAACPQEIFFET